MESIQQRCAHAFSNSATIAVISILTASNTFAQVADAASPIPKAQSSHAETVVTTTASAAGNPAGWEVQLQDKTLYQTLRRWTANAGYQLMWEADRDFPIEANASFAGSIEEAISKVLQSLQSTDYPLQATINPKNKLIRVIRLLEAPRS